MSGSGATLVPITPLFSADIAALAALIGERPAGARLDVPGLARALLPSQADIIDAIRVLIDEGALDARTLRPPARLTRCLPDGITGPQLFERLKAEAGRRGMSLQAASLAVFDNKARIYGLQKSPGPVRAPTIRRATAWLNRPEEPGTEGAGGDRTPPPALKQPNQRGERRASASSPSREREPRAGAKRASAPDAPVTGAELAAEIDAFLERTGMGRGRFSNLVFDCGTGLNKLRDVGRPRAETVAKVRAFLANPPPSALASGSAGRRVSDRAPLGDRRYAANREPPTDLAAEPVARRKHVRRCDAIRRGIVRAAEERIDAGLPASAASSANIRTAQRAIEEVRREQARVEDPVEQAKVVLRRRGRVVYAASVAGGPADRFVVSGMGCEVTAEQLIAAAARLPGGEHLKPYSEGGRA